MLTRIKPDPHNSADSNFSVDTFVQLLSIIIPAHIWLPFTLLSTAPHLPNLASLRMAIVARSEET
ncbi:hypothetical protein Hypma_007804 [Hypsizygus marmoreus]|uniref:Uncharacterized protein n=1 Tax=Hypsizygus marmoreus TaxID=39966 RepID=A0A369K196_HYPMA|nr:hypothetical protein Hypma_007804 [Hypsizygus marmoreus]